jgi:hypothetical protein
MKIDSLYRVSLAVRDGAPLDDALAALLHHVAGEVRRHRPVAGGPLPVPPSAFRDEPESLLIPARKARLRATARHLARLAGKPAPAWAEAA